MNINEFVDFLTTDDIEYVKDLFTELDAVYKNEMNRFYYSKEYKTEYTKKLINAGADIIAKTSEEIFKIIVD